VVNDIYFVTDTELMHHQKLNTISPVHEYKME